MTPKERIITALRNEQPDDMVPITLGLSEMVPVRKSGLSYIDYFWREQRNLVYDRCDVEKVYGADVFVHSAESRSPHDPEVTRTALSTSPEEVVFEERIHTGKGDLVGVKRITVTESIAILKGCVDDPEADVTKVRELLRHPDSKDFTQYLDDWQYVGDAGHCGFWLSTPVDWWSQLRGTPEKMIFDLLDHEELMADLFAEYTEYAVALLTNFLGQCRYAADSIGIGGSTTSMSVISPEILERWIAGFVTAIKKVTARFEVPIQYHMCGKSRQGIPILVEAGVDGMDALECPPTGNIDLREVKERFGEKISLRGNVNSITVMFNGTPADVERDVVRCLDAAKSGGGFILGIGDQTPYWTPDENIFAYVEAGRRYGKYTAK